MAISMVMLGGTALAAPPTGPGPASESFIVTGLSIKSVQTAGLNTTVDVAITVYDTGNQTGTWEFPMSSIIGGNPNALPTIKITNKATNKSVTATALSLVSSPDPQLGPPQSATAIYAFTVPTSQLGPLGDQYGIQLVPHPSGVFHMYQATSSPSQYNTTPVDDPTPPPSVVGQLPEVPLAAGLPLVALGTVGALWMLRRNAHHRSAAQ